MVRKKKKAPVRDKIMFDLYQKLINYRYEYDPLDSYDKKGYEKHGPNELDSSPKKNKENHGLFKPKILKSIEKELKKILTPKKTYHNGWVIIEHIEEKDCPYPKETANSKRYDYLKVPEIEISKMEYRNKHSKLKSKTVYRLNPNIETLKKLILIYVERNELEYFFESDYCKDNEHIGNLLIDFVIRTSYKLVPGDRFMSEPYKIFIFKKTTPEFEKVILCFPDIFALYIEDVEKFKKTIINFNGFMRRKKLITKNLSPINLLAISFITNSYFSNIRKLLEEKEKRSKGIKSLKKLLKNQEGIILEMYPTIISNLTGEDLKFYRKKQKEVSKKIAGFSP